MRAGLLERLAHLQDLGVEIDRSPAQRQELTPAEAAEQRDNDLGIDRPALQLVEQLGELMFADDPNLFLGNLWRTFNGGDVPLDQIVASSFLQCCR